MPKKPQLQIVGNDNKALPNEILEELINALSKSYSLKFSKSSDQIKKSIETLFDEVMEHELSNDQFIQISTFVMKVLNSDQETVNEFLSYNLKNHK